MSATPALSRRTPQMSWELLFQITDLLRVLGAPGNTLNNKVQKNKSVWERFSRVFTASTDRIGYFYLADIGAKIRYKYSLKAARPIDALDDNEIPILFIHGADDSLIAPKNSEDMAARTKGRSEFHTIPGAEHAVSVLTEPELYRRIVEDFLESIS